MRRPRGLSLLEVLVTLAIFAMLFAVLTAGWHQSMNAQARLADEADRVRTHQQLSTLLRQALSESLVPALGAGTEFAGDNRGVATETSTSLAPDVGPAPLAVSIKLAPSPHGQRLMLSHGDRASVALPWRFSEARWRYLDGQGQWLDQWPPQPQVGGAPLPLDRDSYLPKLIAFTYRVAGESLSHELLVSPRRSTWRLSEPTPPISVLGQN